LTRIVPLVDAQFAVPGLARWFVEEWRRYYGPDGPGDAEADLMASASRDRLPVAVVALDDEDRILGTAALKAVSAGGDIAPGPWLAPLLVGPEHRGRRVATALIAAIKRHARELGFSELFVSTAIPGGLFERRGGQRFGATGSLRGDVIVYRLAL
jgi:GNAT superfamily N-acetyltransferase